VKIQTYCAVEIAWSRWFASVFAIVALHADQQPLTIRVRNGQGLHLHAPLEGGRPLGTLNLARLSLPLLSLLPCVAELLFLRKLLLLLLHLVFLLFLLLLLLLLSLF